MFSQFNSKNRGSKISQDARERFEGLLATWPIKRENNRRERLSSRSRPTFIHDPGMDFLDSLPVPWRAQPAHKIHLWSAAVGGIQTAHLRNGTCNQCTTTSVPSYIHNGREGEGASGAIRAEARRPHEAKCFRSAYRPCRGFHLWDCMKNSARIFRDVSFPFFTGPQPCYRRSAVSKPIAHSTVRTQLSVHLLYTTQCLNFHPSSTRGYNTNHSTWNDIENASESGFLLSFLPSFLWCSEDSLMIWGEFDSKARISDFTVWNFLGTKGWW